ncbi:MAG TPA: glutamate--tRNA ligase [Flavobacteriaceae bacterium]|nr:glutamate--tRNA ligase [Flavobacteriaceae bacterium]
MKSNVRVRFAPSPTGPLHIGGVRTALFNYLFAKKNNGTFILRIEDTDRTRFVPTAEQYIVDALNWCNIPFDEGVHKNEKFGPYRQSERASIYKKYADKLIENGWGYYAFDTAEELDKQRNLHEKEGKTFIYNHQNRKELNSSLKLSKQEVDEKINNGDPYVIRFKTPENEILVLNDIIRGVIKIDTNTLDDKVLFKSDGMPTYHLANIVDDHLMEITHVIRGEEWLPSMALHILLYRAFDWTPPLFAHLPLILKPIGKGKLSKRDGEQLGFPVFPLEFLNEETNETVKGYKEEGYLPEAFINMLALLGWNPGTEQEIFSLDQLVQLFDLEKVGKSGAKFDPEKTKWFQHKYLLNQSDEFLAQQYQPILIDKNINESLERIIKVVSLIKERATFVKDFWELSDFFFISPNVYEEKTLNKQWKEDTESLLNNLVEIIKSIDDYSSIEIETKVKEWITLNEISFGKIMQPLRLSLVGSLKGPHLFDIIEFIGKEETIKRILKLIEVAKN